MDARLDDVDSTEENEGTKLLDVDPMKEDEKATLFEDDSMEETTLFELGRTKEDAEDTAVAVVLMLNGIFTVDVPIDLIDTKLDWEIFGAHLTVFFGLFGSFSLFKLT